jgi:secondary thiamine-phosphate synthase enzyme
VIKALTADRANERLGDGIRARGPFGRVNFEAMEKELRLGTEQRQVVDLTAEAERFAAEAGGDGLLNVFVPHATAGLALMETGSGSEADLVDALSRLLPRGDRYRHRHGSPGHGADHLLPVLLSPSVSIPLRDGKLRLGRWQSIVVVDMNQDNPRRTVLLTLLRSG